MAEMEREARVKFSIEKSSIAAFLRKIQGITKKKSNLTITENVLFMVSSDKVIVQATDLQTGFSGEYFADVEREGNFAINSKKLYEIVQNFPSNVIWFEETDNLWIEIRDNGDSVRYSLTGFKAEDFPNQPDTKRIEMFEVNASAFGALITKTAFITGSSDDRRPHINGNKLAMIDDDSGVKTLRMLSTDGSRLARVDCKDNPATGTLPENIIISKKGLAEVLKSLPESGNIQIGASEKFFVVRATSKNGKEEMSIRLEEGEFPQTNDIMSRTEGQIVKVDKSAFVGALRRMSILSSENYKGVVFEIADNRFKITATNPDIGESRETFNVIEANGDPLKIAFNPKYFIEALGAVEEETVILNFISEDRPCLLNGEDNTDFLCVIMPMRI